MNKVCRVLLVSAAILFGTCLVSKSCCEDRAATRSDNGASKLQKKVILSLEKIEERVFGGGERNNGL